MNSLADEEYDHLSVGGSDRLPATTAQWPALRYEKRREVRHWLEAQRNSFLEPSDGSRWSPRDEHVEAVRRYKTVAMDLH